MKAILAALALSSICTGAATAQALVPAISDRQHMTLFGVSGIGVNYLTPAVTRPDGVKMITRWVFFPETREIDGKRYNTLSHALEVDCMRHASRSAGVTAYWAELFGPDTGSHPVATETSTQPMAPADSASLNGDLIDLACGVVSDTTHPSFETIVQARAYALIMLAKVN